MIDFTFYFENVIEGIKVITELDTKIDGYYVDDYFFSINNEILSIYDGDNLIINCKISENVFNDYRNVIIFFEVLNIKLKKIPQFSTDNDFSINADRIVIDNCVFLFDHDSRTIISNFNNKLSRKIYKFFNDNNNQIGYAINSLRDSIHKYCDSSSEHDEIQTILLKIQKNYDNLTL